VYLSLTAHDGTPSHAFALTNAALAALSLTAVALIAVARAARR